MKTEEWKSIAGYEGYYEVSNWGRIRSLTRNIVMKNGVIQTRRGVILKPQQGEDGYLTVSLCKDGERERVFVNDVVAKVWNTCKSIDRETPINNNKQNRLRTTSDNFDKKALDLFSEFDAFETKIVKLTQRQIADIRQRFNSNQATMSELAVEYKVPENRIRNIVKTNKPIFV